MDSNKIPTHPRNAYNLAIVEEAIACREANGTDFDFGLNGQIELVATLPVGEVDGAVDHLRRMLTISYLDDEELPTAFARQDELVEITLRLPAAQVEALRLAAQTITGTTPEADERAAFEALLTVIKPSA